MFGHIGFELRVNDPIHHRVFENEGSSDHSEFSDSGLAESCEDRFRKRDRRQRHRVKLSQQQISLDHGIHERHALSRAQGPQNFSDADRSRLAIKFRAPGREVAYEQLGLSRRLALHHAIGRGKRTEGEEREAGEEDTQLASN